MQLPSGSLFVMREDRRECVYERAVATIRRSSVPFQYVLAITPHMEDKEEEDAAIEETTFLIDEALAFRTSVRDQTPSFVWRDVQGESFEFVVDTAMCNSVMRSVFEVTYLQCAWERKTGQSHELATDEDLERLKPGETSMPTANAGAPTRAPPAESLQSVTGTQEPTVVLTATADLYLYDQASGLFMRQEKHVTAKVAEVGRFLYWMVVDGAESPWLSQGVDSRMNMNFSLENLSAVWNYYDEQRHVYSWLLRFGEKAAYHAFQETFSHLLWETLHEEKWGKASGAEQQYLEQAYEQDVAMTDDEGESHQRTLLSPRHTAALSEDESDVDAIEAQLDPMDEEDEESVEAATQVDDVAPVMPDMGRQERNSALAVGYKSDRAFVVRGDKIGVFKHTDDDTLEFSTAINRISTPQGRSFVPQRVMLHDQDTDMVLMDPSNKHTLYRMDLEYGKVVDEWHVHDDVPVNNIMPTSKYAPMTAEKTFLGTSRNGIFRIDPRLRDQTLVDSQFKLYATKHDFSAAATDASGRLAVASNKGDLRLFDNQIGKNAKTALPSLGDPIIGVDVSADGRWVIATCRTYLLLIDTLIGEGRYQGHLGFDRAFPADSRPLPRRLQLRPHHVAYMDSEVRFTPAHFNTGSDAETSIVTSTGNYVVSWSFEAVKHGNPYAYVLKRYGGTVVRDDYTYGSDQSIVVAFEDDVQLAKRAQLRKPTRASLAPAATQPRTSAGRLRRQTQA